MSSVQDHPDIEKIAANIDGIIYGIPVRETIRTFFANSPKDVDGKPLYGTPDDISKAGCLALALKSNEVGADDKGHVVWNEWRKMFPTRGRENAVDFSNVDFSRQHIVFSGFQFGDFANFGNTKWFGNAKFNGACWGDSATFMDTIWVSDSCDFPAFSANQFVKAQWGAHANFRNVYWGHNNNFKDARWGNHSDFTKAKWGDFNKFICAQWGACCEFNETQWGDGNNFKAARWGQSAIFREAIWGNDANFRGAVWSFYVNFQGARWGNKATFDGAICGAKADFKGTQWGSGASFQNTQFRGEGECNFQGAQFHNKVYFDGAHWSCDVDFSACPWEQLGAVYQNDSAMARARDWAKERGVSPQEFWAIDFSGATFDGVANFSNRQFNATTTFGFLPRHVSRQKLKDLTQINSADLDDPKLDIFEENQDQHRHTIFGKAPIFHGSELHQDTSFEGAQFPPASGSEDAARAYRTLKLAFSKQQAIREEQRFFRLEMEEETLRETGLKRWLFQAYKTFSDYGFSVTRPLMYGVLGVLCLTFVYGLLSWLGQCVFSTDACHFAPQWLEFSLLQTLPLPGLDKLSEVASKAFWPVGAWWSLGLSALVIVHKTISLAALFLIGLALRNLFKLK